MASDIVKLEISQNLINDLFTAAGLETPEELDDTAIIQLIKTIKLLNKADDKTAPTKVPKKDSSTKQASVLVVDDLGLVVYQLSLLLTKNGYNVLLARSAPEAFSIFEERGPFNYVLMDLFMPNKEDGIELLKKVKGALAESGANTKVVVMSATKDIEAIDEVISLGADSFLEKGQNWKSDLIETLQTL